ADLHGNSALGTVGTAPSGALESRGVAAGALRAGRGAHGSPTPPTAGRHRGGAPGPRSRPAGTGAGARDPRRAAEAPVDPRRSVPASSDGPAAHGSGIRGERARRGPHG